MTVGEFGSTRTGNFLTGVTSLNETGMPLLAIWVLLCGGLAPLGLLASLAVSRRHPDQAQKWGRVLTHWAMPEVYMLAVCVALTRLDNIVEVQVNAGLWCYVAMSLALLVASQAFARHPRPSTEL